MKFLDNLRYWDKEKRYRYIMLLALSLAGDGWSYESTVIGSIIQLPPWLAHLGYEDGIPDDKNQWIGPVYSLGQLAGGLVAALVLDKFGRKLNLWMGAVLMILSTILLIISGSFGMVIVARVIEGWSIGHLLLGYQIYAVEIAAKEDRGFVSSFTLMTGNFFGLLAAGIIYGISYTTDNSGWRAALGITFIPATILMMVLPWIPESPRWLFENGRAKESRDVMRKLHGGKVEADGTVRLSEAAELEFEAMQAALSWDKEHGQDRWSALWNTKAARYRSFVAISSQSWWAWNGGSIFTYYYTIVYAAAGITNTQTQFGIAAIQNATWCIGGVVGGYLLDYWGRRTNYLIGVGQASVFLVIQGAITIGIFDKGIENISAGAAFVLVLLSPVFYTITPSTLDTACGAMSVALSSTFYLLQWFLWVTFFSPVVNMLPAEIYSAGLRSRGYAIANVVSMGMGFATQYSALPMYRNMNGWVWIFFAGVMAFAFLVIFFTYPETKGIRLEEVEEIFGTGAGQRVKEALGKGRARANPETPIRFNAQADIDEVEKGKSGEKVVVSTAQSREAV